MDRHSRIVLVVIAAVTVILVAVAIVVAIQPPPVFDPATPEGTVQAFYQALLDADEDLALTYVEEDLLHDCYMRDLVHVMPDNAHIVIANTEIDGDEARVDIVITETWGGGPFGGSDTFDEMLYMTRSGDGWLITRTPWPLDRICP
ncbi:MAG: hypothetical protein ABFR89_05730 [Actinomycetota bacterium]